MHTLILWLKTFYTTIGQYPTLYDYLAIMREDPVYSGEVSHHMCDSVETNDSLVCHTTNMTCPSICQSHQPSVCHTTNMTCPSICQPCQPLICHTTNMMCPSVCQPHESPVHHTTMATSPSVCQTYIPSVCHNIIPTSPSICQFQDSSVCKPTHDVIIPLVWPTVCSSSATSIFPSANPMVKMPTSIPVQNFLHYQIPGKMPFIHTSTDSSVYHSDSPSVNSSLSAANLSKIPCNYGEKTMVNYLHENPVKSPTVSTSYITPFSARVHVG